MEIYLIRHGSTDLNEQKILRGWLDPPLSELGTKQSELIADFLKDEDVSGIYSSDLIRASKTAEIIGEAVGLSVNITDSLRPINFGDLNGKPLDEISDDLDKLMVAWEFDQNIKAPNGESFRTFQDRIYDFTTNLINDSEKEDCIFLVTHVRVCLYLAQLVCNEFKELEGKDIDRINTIDVSPGNYIEIKEIDDMFQLTGINQLDQESLESEEVPVTSAAGT